MSGPCDTVDEFDEGVEFSVRLGGGGTWIPVVFIVNNMTPRMSISIGDPADLEIRGYSVEVQQIQTGMEFQYSTTVCGFDEQSIQLRWLQTSLFDNRRIFKDVWSIDNVLVRYEPEGNVGGINLLEDFFDVEQLK